MLNRPFSFYLANDGGIAKILGVEPLDNKYFYTVRPGEGKFVEHNMPVKIDVFTDDENSLKKSEFSFSLRYSDMSGKEYKLIIHVKKMEIKSLTETQVPGIHQYTN